MSTLNLWTSEQRFLTALPKDHIFVFGSNPEGRHGFGAALAAKKFFGAKYGQGEGLQGQSYAIITKNLRAFFSEEYSIAGRRSVSLDKIASNIADMYDAAKLAPELKFIVCYANSTKSLNGYSMSDILGCFLKWDIPENVYFHDTFRTQLEQHLGDKVADINLIKL